MSLEILAPDDNAFVVRNTQNKCDRLNSTHNALTPRGKDFKTNWVTDCDGNMHRQIVPTGEQKLPGLRTEKGSSIYKFYPQGIVCVTIIKDANGNLEAVFGTDGSDKQYQIYP